MNKPQTIELVKIPFKDLANRFAGSSHDSGSVATRLLYLAIGLGAEKLVLFSDPKKSKGGQSVLCAGEKCQLKTEADILATTVQGTQRAVAYCDLAETKPTKVA